MNIQKTIGLLGRSVEPAVRRSWMQELSANTSFSDQLIFVEVEKGMEPLRYSAVIVRLDSTIYQDYETFLGAMIERDVPIVLDIVDERIDVLEILSLLGSAALVVTEFDSIAKAVGTLSRRVLVWGDSKSIFQPLENSSSVNDAAEPKRWLWVIGDKLTPETFSERVEGIQRQMAGGLNHQLSVVGTTAGMRVPEWVETIQVPESIAEIGGSALGIWLASFSGRWTSALWDKSEGWHISQIYRDLDLEIFGCGPSGELSAITWSESKLLSDDHRILDMQQSVLEILELISGTESTLDNVVLIQYNHTDALKRQDVAFPDSRKKSFRRSPSNSPLVSILIPAYNRPEYLSQALESALFQTYGNIEIIIGDDSTSDDVEKLIRSEYLPKYSNIKYWRNESNRGQYQNDLDLIAASNGKYLNILMDDDLLHLDKIRSQMAYFLGENGTNIGLVTSHRAVVDAQGVFRSIFDSTSSLFKKTVRLSGYDAIQQSLISNRNFLGEPTTVLFRKSMLRDEFGSLFGRRYVCNVDHSSWLQILQEGDAIFMNDALSAYRFHDGQQSWTARAALGGAVDFAHATWELHARGYLQGGDEFKAASRKCLERIDAEQVKILDLDSLDDEGAQLYEAASEYRERFRDVSNAT
ncbi:glycosyltransferase family 2 protein [Arthrobacter sp. AQ5-05]|uniref:glycosyltransferase family 2 protein n=1 Tax=Arthrobacter sp. AQ5-05 TaxID=2184581 RepID=UPI0012B5AC5A|nr:glycosyltransferase family A protein [Arthrobacter sp. AQ5-05]